MPAGAPFELSGKLLAPSSDTLPVGHITVTPVARGLAVQRRPQHRCDLPRRAVRELDPLTSDAVQLPTYAKSTLCLLEARRAVG